MADAFIPLHALKGRGAASRLAHRFERDARAAFDDGWGTLEEGETEAQGLMPPQTEVRFEDVKSVLSENDSPDIPFDRSLNPYRGCEHVMPTQLAGASALESTLEFDSMERLCADFSSCSIFRALQT